METAITREALDRLIHHCSNPANDPEEEWCLALVAAMSQVQYYNMLEAVSGNIARNEASCPK